MEEWREEQVLEAEEDLEAGGAVAAAVGGTGSAERIPVLVISGAANNIQLLIPKR